MLHDSMERLGGKDLTGLCAPHPNSGMANSKISLFISFSQACRIEPRPSAVRHEVVLRNPGRRNPCRLDATALLVASIRCADKRSSPPPLPWCAHRPNFPNHAFTG